MRVTKYIAISLLFVLSLVLLLKGGLPQVFTGTWTATNSLTAARSGSAAAALPDGRILFTGGTGDSGPLASAELFNPDGSTSSANPMQDARTNHTAVVLQDGRVLVAGGSTFGGGITNAAELYSPSTNSWTPVAGGMTAPRAWHTASRLKDGTVVIAGGQSTSGTINTLEVFSPESNTFIAVTSGMLSSPRQQHAAAALSDGRVLIAGGSNGSASLNSTDIFDPAAVAVSAGPNLSNARAGLSATTLIDGRVLLAGGNDGTADMGAAEVYDPSTGTISATSGGLATPRRDHLAFVLPNNNGVLIVGGSSAGTALASAELFYPWTNAFTATGPMSTARTAAAGGTLNVDGRLLVAGGSNGSGNVAGSELYGFATIKTDKDDYAPGTTVTITGSGWQPGETVTLTLVESPLLDTHGPFTTVADSFGNIVHADFSPDERDINIKFSLTAAGSVSQAQTTFTDASPVTVSCSPTSVTVNTQTTCTASAGGSNTNTITWSASGTGTFSSSTCVMASNQCQVTYTPTATGNQTITATDTTDGSHAPGTFTLTATGAATKYLVTSSSNTPVAGATVTITAQLADAANNPVPTLGKVVTWSSTNGGSFSSPTSTTNASGVATVTFTTSTGAGTIHTVTATDNTSLTGTSGNITTQAGTVSATVSAVSASLPSVPADNTTTSTITVTLKDANSNPVSGKAVSLTPGSGSSTITTVSGTTNASGQATFTVKDAVAQTVTYTAKDTTDNITITQTAAVTFTVGTPTAGNSTVSASLTSVVADGSTTSTITVTLKDASNNPVSGKAVSLGAGSGSSTVTTLSGTTNASGQATFTVKDTAIEAVTYTATDTTDSVTISQTATVTFTVGPVSASASTVVASPTSVPADNTTTSTITVTLFDSSSHPVSAKTVTLSQTGSSTITTVSGTTNASGQATFTVKDATAQSVTYTATSSSPTTTITQTAAVTFGDITPPTTASVTAPANGSILRAATLPANLGGSVADNAGGVGLNANSTTFILQRGSDNNYWNGSAWQAGIFSLAATNNATTGNTVVTWASGATLPTWASEGDGTYLVQATATDKAGNFFTGVAVTFTLDNTVPATASVAAPVDGAFYMPGQVPAIFSGSAADNTGGVGLAANSTTFILQRGSDNFYWTGATWQAAVSNLATTQAATTSGAAVTWQDSVTLPTWSTQSGGTYIVQATAIDKAGNIFTGPAVSFNLAGAVSPRSLATANNNGPTTSITSTAVSVSTANTVFVTIAMDPDSGTPVTVTDTGSGGSNTYTKNADIANGTGESGVRTLIFSAPVTHTLSNGTITISTGTAVNMAATFFSFNGLVSPPIDTSHTATGTGVSLSSGATSTTAQIDEVLIGAMGIEGKSGGQGFGSFTAGTGFTALTQVGLGGQATHQITMQPEYQVVKATGAYSATGTISNSTTWASAIGTYKIIFPTATITLADSNPPTSSPVHFTVTFSANVFGVDTSNLSHDFALATSGTGCNASIASISGSGATYTVTVNTGTGCTTIGLNLVDDDTITNINSVPLGGTAAGNGNVTGPSYTLSIATTLALSSPSPSSVAFGSTGPVTMTATLTRNDTSAAVNGASVTFTVDGSSVGSTTTNSSGVATLSYNPSSLSTAGHSVQASFAQSTLGGTTFLASTSATQTLIVNKATPVITWSNPADITYPAALSGTQLNATANVPGTFVYTPAAATTLNAGNSQILSTTFTPTDTTNYNTAIKTVNINVLKGTPVITWSNPADITYAAALSGTQLNATANVPGSFVYTPAAGATLNAGNSQILSTTFTPTDTANYSTATKTVTINVLKGTPVITWSNPADISYPAALSATQLNATANVPGSFVYTPAAGATLNAGNGQTLSTTFTPNDTTNYNTATKTVSINVQKGTATVTLSNLTQTFSGVALSPTAATAPAGLALVWTNAPQINAASYAVTATVNDANYTGSATGTFIIEPATAGVTVTDPNVMWDGSAHGATISTAPSGLAYTATYTGTGQTNYAASTTQPTDPGTYAVSVKVTDGNYFGSMGTGTLTINNTDAVVSSEVKPLYDFSAKSASTDATVIFENVSTKGITNISTVTPPATPVDTTKYKLSSSPAYYDLATTALFTGNIQVCLVYTPANLIKPANLVLLHLNSGTHEWDTISSTVDQAHTKVCGTVTSLSPFTLAESATTTTTLTVDNANPTYGNQVTFSATVAPSDAEGTVQFYDNGSALGSPVSVSGGQAQLPTSALTGGSHSITATYSPSAYYSSSESAAVGVTVTKADQAPVSVSAPSDATYGQTGLSATASGGSGTGAYVFYAAGSTACTVNSTTGAITVTSGTGTCTITAKRNGDSNYNNSAMSTPSTVTIHKATATVTMNAATVQYDGNSHSVTALTTPTGLAVNITYDGSATAPTNVKIAGGVVSSYAVVATISDPNYQGSGTGSLTITKATSTTTFTSVAPSPLAYNGTYTPTATSTGDGTLTIGTSGSCSITGGLVKITSGSGMCTVTATESEGNNHLGSSATAQTITAIKATATVMVNSATVQYDGTSHSVTAPTTPTGLAVNITYDGSATAPTNVKIAGGVVSSYAVAATISDPNYQGSATGTLLINQASATVNLGNLTQPYTGSPLSVTAATVPPALPLNFTYTPATPINPGLYTVTATSANPNYAGGISGTLTINDVAPPVTITAPASGYIAAANSNVTFTGTFSDLGPKGPYTAKFTFDGGTTITGTVVTNPDGKSGTVSATYAFTSAGVYKVALAVTDKYNTTGTATTVNNDSTSPAFVVVYDPSAGFVTGGGWINSPAGAYAANPTLAGKANFGFVSKYQSGAKTPTGETEFNYQVANFNFHASVYQWLVVSGSQAQYKGSGTINGSGNYNFLLTALDGDLTNPASPDGFRIKITHPTTNAVIYDNKMSSDDTMNTGNTPNVGGGSIVIHTGK